MGRVLLAYDRLDERLVALKYPAQRADDTEVKHRLDREAALLDRLARAEIPGVVRFLDRFDDHGPVFVMEHVDGCTLSRLGTALDRGLSFGDAFAEASQTKGAATADGSIARSVWSRRTVVAYLEFLAQAATTLAAVHEAGTVHNDVKPDNLMVRRGLRALEPVWIDFGIGKATDAETRLTGMAGTPAFSAPESRRGEWTARSDVYSFGALLDEEVSSRDARIEALIPHERALLAELVRQCKKEDASKRPASARDIAAVLNTLASGELVEAEEAKRKSGRSRRVRLWVGLVAIAVVSIVKGIREARTDEEKASVTASASATAPAEAPSAPSASPSSVIAVSTPSEAANVAPARPLSANCKRWLEAAATQRFEGEFGDDMVRLAKAIALRKLESLDLAKVITEIPCAMETDAAWDAYVTAAMADSSKSAWIKNTNLVVSQQLKDALAEKHRTLNWPESQDVHDAIARNATRIVNDINALEAQGRANDIRRKYADAACTFAWSVGIELHLCELRLKQRGKL